VSKSSICLLNTRPEHQSQPLDELLNANGFQTLPCPSLEIVGTTISPKQRQSLDELVSQKTFDAIFITSVNALVGWVNQCPEHFVRNNAPVQMKAKDTGRLNFDLKDVSLVHELACPVFAIGEATAQAAQNLGLQVKLFPRKQFVSEDLMQQILLDFQVFADVPPRRVALLSGVGGRNVIKTQLSEQGSLVEEFELYRRQPAQFCSDSWLVFVKSSRPVILVSSLESWQSLFTLLVDWDSDYQSFKNSVWQSIESWLVFSPRIKQSMVEQGVPEAKICVVSIQSNQGILDSLQRMSLP